MTLEVQVHHAFERLALDVSFTCGAGLTALIGPSGAGKTTVLNVVAGLLRPDRAVVRLDGEAFVDTERNVWAPPHRRRVGYMCQEPRLFPHLSVRQNLLYGRWFTPTPGRRVHADDVVALLDLGNLLPRRPAKLSGGEKQRVALGRALLMSPRLLLLDEPLASVDAERKGDILPYLDRLRAELTMPVIYVTHAIAEITGRADTVIVLDNGKVDSQGPPVLAVSPAR